VGNFPLQFLNEIKAPAFAGVFVFNKTIL
jgi:hypothetical protein